MIRSLDRHIKDDILFTYLDTSLDVSQPLTSTTNPLEGGINAPLKAFLYAHRGWPEHHMLTAINYWLHTRSINPQPLETFINNTHPIKTTPTPKPDPDTPPEIDNTINQEHPWEDGLNIQKSWGRH